MSTELQDLQNLLWRPAFEYLDCDVPIYFDLAIPQHFWKPRSTAVGGHDIATSGVPETFVIRHDRTLVMKVRMTETEYLEDFEPMIKTLWAQGQIFTVWLDANDDATARAVSLVRPWMEDGLEPEDGDLLGEFVVDLVVRTYDGSMPQPTYFLDFDDYGD